MLDLRDWVQGFEVSLGVYWALRDLRRSESIVESMSAQQ